MLSRLVVGQLAARFHAPARWIPRLDAIFAGSRTRCTGITLIAAATAAQHVSVLVRPYSSSVQVELTDLVAAFGRALSYDGVATPDSHCHDQWWAFPPHRPVYGGMGIHGRRLWSRGRARL